MSAAQSNSGKGRAQSGGRGGQVANRPAPGGRANGAGRAANAGRVSAPPPRRSSAHSGGPARPGGPGPGRPINARGPRPSRLSPSTIAIGAVSLVVVIVVALIAVKVTSGGSGSSGANGLKPPPITPASATVLSEVEHVPVSVQNAVGAWSSVGTPGLTPPTYKPGQPPLKLGPSPLPYALYVGGLFCPYCAATRWSLLMAFSKFGTFTGVGQTTSSPWDSYPDTPTFDFTHAHYTSSYINFDPVEYLGQDTTGVDTHTVLTPLTPSENKVYTHYDTVNGQTGVPFVDIANKVFVTGAPIDPQLLESLGTWSAVASQLTNPKSQVTQAIVGTANDFIAGICAATGQQPASVCSVAGVKAAATAMGLP